MIHKQIAYVLLCICLCVFLSSCSFEDFRETAKEFFNELSWWEWIVFFLLIIFLILLVLALLGVEFAIAILTAIVKFILVIIYAICRAIAWVAIRLYNFVLKPVGGWLKTKLRPSLAELWKDIKGSAKWDIIKGLGLLGGGVLLRHIFGDNATNLSCPGTKTTTITLNSIDIQRDYPGGKSATEVQADAKNNAEAHAKKIVTEALAAEADKYTCANGCIKTVTTSGVNIVPTTVVVCTYRGTIWYTYQATATATGTVTISCQGE